MTIVQTFMLAWLLALAASLVLVPASIYLGHRFALVSNPRLFGKSERVVPNVGGIGLAMATALAFLLLVDPANSVSALVIGAILACLLGLADDRIKFVGSSPRRRLLLQAGIGAVAWFAGFSADAPGPAGFIATVLFLVASMNAFNLLDNMDGVAGLTGAATAFGVAIVALLNGQFLVAALAAALSGACTGFLFFNFRNARVYLGNGGSLVVGFLIGGAVLRLRLPVSEPWAIVSAAALLAVPFTDTVFVMISRLQSGRSVMVGGTDHLSHRLVKLGLSTEMSAVVHGVASLVAAGSVVLVVTLSPWFTVLPVVFFGIGGLLMLRVSIYEGQPPLIRPKVSEKPQSRSTRS